MKGFYEKDNKVVTWMDGWMDGNRGRLKGLLCAVQNRVHLLHAKITLSRIKIEPKEIKWKSH